LDLSVGFGGEVGWVRSRVELFEQIRRDRRLEQLSIRKFAERHDVHRRTVRQALDSAVRPQAVRPPAAAGAGCVGGSDRWLVAG
jgi:hypothetical protein